MQRHGDLALQGELEGVGQQVEHDLFVHVLVHVDRPLQWRAVHAQPQARLLHGRAEHAGQLGRGAGQVRGLVAGLHAPGLDAREVQQGVDQLLQAQRVAVDHLRLIGRQVAAVLAQGVVQRPQDQRQRRAQLVADVGEEHGLGTVHLGQGPGAPRFLLIGHGVRDNAARVACHHIEEGAVLRIQRAARADAQHQHARGLAVARPANGHDARQARGFGPGAARQGQAQLRQVHVGRLARLHGLGQRPGRGVGRQVGVHAGGAQ